MNFSKQEINEFKNIIESIIDIKIANKRIPSYVSAIVVDVDNQGLVTVFIPPETEKRVTGLLNKTGEILIEGDSVEIATKNGSLSNAWIAIKHGNSNTVRNINTLNIDYTKEINSLIQRIEILEKKINDLQSGEEE